MSFVVSVGCDVAEDIDTFDQLILVIAVDTAAAVFSIKAAVIVNALYKCTLV
ncbi:MAG: hypothetical protein IJ201_12690 [Solobacterium sp.]|nr:hypothetical protein [Solobacterium sp.]